MIPTGFCDELRERRFFAVFVYLRAIAGLSATVVCNFAPRIDRPVELRGFLSSEERSASRDRRDANQPRFGYATALLVRVRTARMRTMSAFIASLVVALVVASALADRGRAQRVVTGTVAEYVAGEWISVANETTDPMGFQIALRATAAFEGDPALIKPGTRVTVWYRSAAERRPLADKVRVLTEAATH
jgi:hypothetical protein